MIDNSDLSFFKFREDYADSLFQILRNKCAIPKFYNMSIDTKTQYISSSTKIISIWTHCNFSCCDTRLSFDLISTKNSNLHFAVLNRCKLSMPHDVTAFKEQKPIPIDVIFSSSPCKHVKGEQPNQIHICSHLIPC